MPTGAPSITVLKPLPFWVQLFYMVATLQPPLPHPPPEAQGQAKGLCRELLPLTAASHLAPCVNLICSLILSMGQTSSVQGCLKMPHAARDCCPSKGWASITYTGVKSTGKDLCAGTGRLT
eukprot:1158619-Pelagomonas_calceolata.AAC.6